MACADDRDEPTVIIEDRGITGVDRKFVAIPVTHDILSRPGVTLPESCGDFPGVLL